MSELCLLETALLWLNQVSIAGENHTTGAMMTDRQWIWFHKALSFGFEIKG